MIDKAAGNYVVAKTRGMAGKWPKLLFAGFLAAVLASIVWPPGGKARRQTVFEIRNAFAPEPLFGSNPFAELSVAQDNALLPERKGRGIVNAGALQGFFAALAESRAGQRTEPVRVLHYGDSHVAADILTAVIRNNLQRDFKDAGAGYLSPGNPFSTKRRGVTASVESGWFWDGIGRQGGASDGYYGLAGFSLSANRAGAAIKLSASGNHFEIYYLQRPDGGRLEVSGNGLRVPGSPWATNARLGAGYFTVDFSDAGLQRLEIRAVDNKPVRVLGVVAERVGSGGVAYDVLGINGARLKRWQEWNADILAGNLARRQPQLVILAYGSNEVADPDWTPESYTRLVTSVVRQVKQAAPGAAVIVCAPPERADSELAAQRMPLLVEAQRQAAQDNGAAFWSAYDAMGGAGAMEIWVASKLGYRDRVHLTKDGYQRIGAMFYEDLMAAYRKRG